ncbi:hypothetical protein ACWDZ8_03135, partial [Streptomyces sp. NPDC003233]
MTPEPGAVTGDVDADLHHQPRRPERDVQILARAYPAENVQPLQPDFVYVPVEVPAGVREIKVSYTYDRPSVPAGT